MAHFAEIRSDTNTVIRVIIANDNDIANNGGEYSSQSEQWAASNYPQDPILLQQFNGNYPQTYWKQTSYNTRLGKHILGGIPKRKNYAGTGMFYDSQKDAFYWPKINDSAIYNLEKGEFEAPVAQPTIFQINNRPVLMNWNEENQRWEGTTLLNNITTNYFWNPSNSSWTQI
jgi:hypothetical protein